MNNEAAGESMFRALRPNTALQPTGQKLRFCPSAELRRWAS